MFLHFYTSMKNYTHEGIEYSVQFDREDIRLEGEECDLIIKGGYTDLKLEAIRSSSSFSEDPEEGLDYDGSEVQSYVEEFWEEYIKENISKAEVNQNI